jgi:putative colanic acid biosynthesis acetyltransferase WcaF
MLDVQQNRAAQKYSRAELAGRFLWSCVYPFFRCSPRRCFAWRRFLLRLFGGRIGANVHIYASAKIYIPWNLELGAESAIGEDSFIYNLGRLTIGQRAVISHRVHLCGGTHDYTKSSFPLLRTTIDIGSDVWVGADAFIGPGVTIGDGAIVGARAVVIKDVRPWVIVAGNPAREIKSRAMPQ